MHDHKTRYDLRVDVHDFIKKYFTPHFEYRNSTFYENSNWQKCREIGTDLWLDSGDVEEIKRNWTTEFTSLTTNNTLLNKEVQKGTYDDLIEKFMHLFEDYPNLTLKEKKLETAFVLNAVHALNLVDRFNSFVSVEEHTDLAYDIDLAVEYGRRFHEISDRFIVKVPFTPAGLLAARRLSDEGVPVNHTLGFSARQNYAMTRIARPDYVNVFMGRLNSFIEKNGLGGGNYVGQKATIASQAAVSRLRQAPGIGTRQIAASLRSADQILDLVGVDVITMPPEVARAFVEMKPERNKIVDNSFRDFKPEVNPDVDTKTLRLTTLWLINNDLVKCIDKLEREDIYSFSAQDLVDFFTDNKCGDVLVSWDKEQIMTSKKEGKIPELKKWRDLLQAKLTGLDSLMNLAGFCSFASDQEQMDNKIQEVMEKAVVHHY